MVGNPTETLEEMQNTLNFVINDFMYSLIGIMITVPFPATEMWDWAKTNGKIPNQLDWNKFQFQYGGMINLSNIPTELLNAYVNYARGIAFRNYELNEPKRIEMVSKIKNDLMG